MPLFSCSLLLGTDLLPPYLRCYRITVGWLPPSVCRWTLAIALHTYGRANIGVLLGADEAAASQDMEHEKLGNCLQNPTPVIPARDGQTEQLAQGLSQPGHPVLLLAAAVGSQGAG